MKHYTYNQQNAGGWNDPEDFSRQNGEDPLGQRGSQPPEPPYRSRPPVNAMTAASVVCGVLALVTCYLIFTAFLFGSLAVLFAVLAKGKNRRITRSARIGQVLGIISIAVGGILSAISVSFVIARFGGIDKAVERYTYYIEKYANDNTKSGQDLYNEIYQDIYGKGNGNSSEDSKSSDSGNTNDSDSSGKDSNNSNNSSDGNNNGSYYGDSGQGGSYYGNGSDGGSSSGGSNDYYGSAPGSAA
jgi:uncharacterized membrane protein YgcG